MINKILRQTKFFKKLIFFRDFLNINVLHNSNIGNIKKNREIIHESARKKYSNTCDLIYEKAFNLKNELKNHLLISDKKKFLKNSEVWVKS